MLSKFNVHRWSEVGYTQLDDDKRTIKNKYMVSACVDCRNEKMSLERVLVPSHLIHRGFIKNKTCWTKHREQEPLNIPIAEVRDV